MVQPLAREGLTDVGFLAVVTPGPTGSWADHAEGFESATFPVLLDTKGVYYIYGVEPYEVVLVDKRGRLVTRQRLTADAVDGLKQRIRQLHAE